MKKFLISCAAILSLFWFLPSSAMLDCFKPKVKEETKRDSLKTVNDLLLTCAMWNMNTKTYTSLGGQLKKFDGELVQVDPQKIYTFVPLTEFAGRRSEEEFSKNKQMPSGQKKKFETYIGTLLTALKAKDQSELCLLAQQSLQKSLNALEGVTVSD